MGWKLRSFDWILLAVCSDRRLDILVLYSFLVVRGTMTGGYGRPEYGVPPW